MRKKHELLDAHKIDTNLWQGSVPAPSIRASEFKLLVLTAREHQDLSFSCGPEITVLRAPNDDHSAYPFTREKLKVALEAARQVVTAIQQGLPCLVTCAAGMNRSGLVSALTLHLLHGWSGDQCIRRVRKRRGYGRGGYRPLSNPDFTAALRRLPAKDPEAPSPYDGWGRSAGGIIIPL